MPPGFWHFTHCFLLTLSFVVHLIYTLEPKQAHCEKLGKKFRKIRDATDVQLLCRTMKLVSNGAIKNVLTLTAMNVKILGN